jgi:hypothetical protein
MDYDSAASHDYKWQGNWSFLIREHVAKLQPKPEYLVFNVGPDPKEQQEIKEALRAESITGIYMTSTYPREHDQNMQRFPHEARLCGKVFPLCVDYKWTSDYMGDEHYFDHGSPKPHIHAKMNQQLLGILKNVRTRDFDATGSSGALNDQ